MVASQSTILIHLSVRLCVVCDHWTQFVSDHWTHRLRDRKKKSDGGRREKWQEKDETTVGCVAASVWVVKPRSWNQGPAGCPGLIPGFFFFFFSHPFPTGGRSRVPTSMYWLQQCNCIPTHSNTPLQDQKDCAFVILFLFVKNKIISYLANQGDLLENLQNLFKTKNNAWTFYLLNKFQTFNC
jgi:hypothetical protein